MQSRCSRVAGRVGAACLGEWARPLSVRLVHPPSPVCRYAPADGRGCEDVLSRTLRANREGERLMADDPNSRCRCRSERHRHDPGSCDVPPAYLIRVANGTELACCMLCMNGAWTKNAGPRPSSVRDWSPLSGQLTCADTLSDLVRCELPPEHAEKHAGLDWEWSYEGDTVYPCRKKAARGGNTG